MCRLTLNGMLGFHVQFLGHLVAIIGKEIIIKRLVIACNATPYGGCMSCEDGSYGRYVFPDIQGTKTCHPFVSLIDHTLLSARKIVIVITFHNTPGCIGKHRSLVVVTIGMYRLDSIISPKRTVQSILCHKVRLEIHEDNTRATGNVPMPYPNAYTLCPSLLDPCAPQRAVFVKQRILFPSPEIWTNKHQTVFQLLLQCLGSRREYRVYASHFITDFPTRFKHKSREHLFVFHQNNAILWAQNYKKRMIPPYYKRGNAREEYKFLI